ncbi:DUF895 domain membrane protein [Sarracenia purpurea var. burkii]
MPDYSGDAYYALAVVYGVLALFNFVVPPIISVLGTRISMVLGSIGYAYKYIVPDSTVSRCRYYVCICSGMVRCSCKRFVIAAFLIGLPDLTLFVSRHPTRILRGRYLDSLVAHVAADADAAVAAGYRVTIDTWHRLATGGMLA